MILIAYDGSDDAKAAITTAGKLFPGEPVTILNAWQHFIDTLARTGAAGGLAFDTDAIDASTKQVATERVSAAVELAAAAGLGAASAETAAVTTTLADAIISEARRVDARAIVLGSRGLGSVRAFLLGSVSSAVLHHADRPVVVVPSPDVIAHRVEHA